MAVATPTSIQTLEILILGLPDAGKSTFLRTISRQQTDAHGWYCGTVAVDDWLRIRFLEPPKQRHFDFMWLRELVEHVNVPGIIVVCDSTRPEYFGGVVGMLETIRYYHPYTPCTLVANKQDEPYAWTAEDIRLGLGIPDSIDVISCNAKRMQDVKKAVLRLLYQILD